MRVGTRLAAALLTILPGLVLAPQAVAVTAPAALRAEPAPAVTAAAPVEGAVTVPAPAGAAPYDGTELSAVDCADVICTAVGLFTLDSGGQRPMLATRAADGTWSSVQLRLPRNASVDPAPELRDLDCFAAPDVCIVVGSYTTATGVRAPIVVERADGRVSLTVPVRPRAGNAEITSLECVTATWCYAVGSVADRPLTLRRDGNGWSSARPALPRGATGGRLDDVACLTSSQCYAVGASTGPRGWGRRPLVLEGSGTWTALGLTLPADGAATPDAEFTAITCVVGLECHAVGSYATSTAGRRPLEAGRGGMRGPQFGAARSVPLPGSANAAPGAQAYLTDLSCAGIDTNGRGGCFATGSYRATADGSSRSMIADVGSQFGRVADVPTIGTADRASTATRIVCVALAVCGGVGFEVLRGGPTTYFPSAYLFSFAGTWPGAHPAPSPSGSSQTALNGLTLLPRPGGTGPVYGLAVGSYQDGGVLRRGLAVIAKIAG